MILLCNTLFYVIYLIVLDVDYRLYITWSIRQKLCGYKVEEKLRFGLREQRRLNNTALEPIKLSAYRDGLLILLAHAQHTLHFAVRFAPLLFRDRGRIRLNRQVSRYTSSRTRCQDVTGWLTGSTIMQPVTPLRLSSSLHMKAAAYLNVGTYRLDLWYSTSFVRLPQM
jgi:hypothetical protein